MIKLKKYLRNNSDKVSYKIIDKDDKIVEILFSKKNKLERDVKEKKSLLEQECRKQIEEYLSGKRKTFSVSLKIEGTDFQRKVWREMMKIPYGETISYKELAERIKKPKAYRAVANACGANNLPIIIPCHRVVASNGIGGYSAGIEIKKKLLELENINITK